MRCFISTVLPLGRAATRCREVLAGMGMMSVASPAPGRDPRWPTWYRGGAAAEIGASDFFVGLDFDGYDTSVMMAIEFGEATKVSSAKDSFRMILLRERSSVGLGRAFQRFSEWGEIVAVDGRDVGECLQQSIAGARA